MITIYDKNKDILGQDPVSAIGIVNTERQWCIVYINYHTKGTETSLQISFQIQESIIGLFFDLQVDDGTQIVSYVRDLQPGTYRIPLPIAKNEDRLKVIAKFTGDTTSPGSADIWVIPSYYGS